MNPTSRVVFACVLLTAVAAPCVVAEPIAEFKPPTNWQLPGENAFAITARDQGGPQDGAWAEMTYGPNASANIGPAEPMSLEPGTLLNVWVKGNGSEDELYFYIFGGKGHRAYNIPLNDTNWRQVSFDITEDFGENHWRWEDAIPLDLSAIR